MFQILLGFTAIRVKIISSLCFGVNNLIGETGKHEIMMQSDKCHVRDTGNDHFQHLSRA